MHFAGGIKELVGDRFLLVGFADGTSPILHGNDMTNFSYRLIDEPEKVRDELSREFVEFVSPMPVRNASIK